MKKTWVIIGLIGALIAVGGGLAWFVLTKTTTSAPATDLPVSQSPSDLPAASSPVGTTTTEVTISMENTTFQPKTIKVKKGTKVTWINKDTVRHNVVADATNAAGLPTTNDLLGKDGTYSFTFNTVGTVNYHCTPHPFMTGTIEVTE